MALIITTGYCVSRKNAPLPEEFMLFYVFTMYFNGGLIPTYLVVAKMGLLNSVWSLILPGGVAVFNVIVCRTFFESSIPEELYEAASIDGSSNLRTFFRIALPLSKPILAVMVIFTMVAYWNDWFTALIYMSEKSKSLAAGAASDTDTESGDGDDDGKYGRRIRGGEQDNGAYQVFIHRCGSSPDADRISLRAEVF